jgi:hypothetical protein
MNVNLHVKENFDPKRLVKLDTATEMLARVLSSAEFAARVLAFNFADDSGRTNPEILQCILDGAESLDPDKDGEVDLTLSLYWAPFWKRYAVVGYTNGYTRKIWCNAYWFDRMSPAEIAGNLGHEWTHKLGFEHDFSRTARRPRSVPYMVGDLIAELAAKLAAL